MLTYDETVMLKYITNLYYGQRIENYMYERFGERINTIGDEFLAKGFLTLTTAEQNVSFCLAPELKELLKSKGLKVSGSKKELTNRIIDNFSHNELEKLFPNSRYVLTKIGQAEIDANIIYFLNEKLYLNLTNSEIEIAVSQNPNLDCYTILEDLLKKRSNYNMKNDKIGMLGIDYNCIYKVKMEHDDYLNALFYAFAYTYIEESGLTDNNHVLYLRGNEKRTIFVDKIDKCLTSLNMSVKRFKAIAETKFAYELPELAFSYYDIDVIIDMICDRLEGIYKNKNEYPHNTPEENNPNYTYYDYHLSSENPTIHIDINMSE